jgi:hypothetical protein
MEKLLWRTCAASVTVAAALIAVPAMAYAASGPSVSPKSLDDYHEITVLHSGKCLDEDASGDNGFRNGGKVQQFHRWGNSPNQLWKFVSVGGGWYELHLRSSEKCLDIDVSNGQTPANGAQAQQWSCNGQANQHFRLVPGRFDGYFSLQVQHSGKCLDEDASGDNGFRDGGKVQQWTCFGSTNQQWTIVP